MKKDKLFKLGRFSFLFEWSSHTTDIVRWFKFSVGYDTVKFRAWKKRLKKENNK